MNEQNFDFLKNQLKYTGFGEDLQKDLREKLNQQQPNFTLSHRSEFGNEQTNATLYFKKSKQSDLFFFNRYELSLKKDKEDEQMKQSFYIGRENNITLKEGFNLMQGRSIHKELTPKEGEKFQAWLQLNFKETDTNGNFKMKQFHQNYGFDLGESLSKYPIQELKNPESSQSLIRSLERGNRQSVTMLQGGKEQKMFLEANPQYKSLNIYDSNFKRVNMQAQQEKQGEKQTQPQAEKQQPKEARKTSQKESQKEKAGKEDEGAAGKPRQRQSKRQRQSLS